MKKRKIMIITSLSALCLIVFGASMIFNGPKKLNNVKEDLVISASDLYNSYAENESNANTEFLDKVIKVTGRVQEVSVDDLGNMNIYLETGPDAMGTVSCTILKNDIDRSLQVETGNTIEIKGLCTGYLLDVVLTKCIITNKS